MKDLRTILTLVLAVMLMAFPALAAYQGTVLPIAKGGTGATTLDGAGIVTKSGNQSLTGVKTFNAVITSTQNTQGTINSHLVAGFGSGSANRSVSIQQMLNASTANQFLFMNGGLGSTSAVGTPTTTSTSAAAFGIESTDTSMSLIAAPAGTNQTVVRGLTLASSGSVALPVSVVVGGGTALTKVVVYTPSLTPVAVAADTSAEQTFTVTGLATTDTVMVNPPAALGDGLIVGGVRVSATNTLAVRFGNLTTGSLTPAAGTYRVLAVRN